MPVEYVAPTRDMRFVIEELAHFDRVSALPGCEEFSSDLIEAILEEAGKFANGVISPLNWPSDQQGATLQGDEVKTSPGFPQAYAQFVESGWNSLSGNPDFGGQGLPEVLATCVNEMWHAASMSFALCSMLTAGAIRALEHHGSQPQKDKYLSKLISGEWTGTMNLTEPQAGSDLAAIATKAFPLPHDHPLLPLDASERESAFCIRGTKIFITFGEHDLSKNTIHLVLARLPDAPIGVKGISLFLVPKYLTKDDGSLVSRNDVRCISLEKKLGIHGSPTAVMSYGEQSGAIGYLIGERNKGLAYMFTMMNHARLSVGVQGVAISERAYQQAHWYAQSRIQGRAAGFEKKRHSIARHPDVGRMLASMQARIQAMRALAYEAAAYMDLASRSRITSEALEAQARVELLIPVVKAWCTEQSIDIASMGVQIHGGMGYAEETGAAQYLRDARITTIYEGTTAIQANDFLIRKVFKDNGTELFRLLQEIKDTSSTLSAFKDRGHQQVGAVLGAAAERYEKTIRWILENRSPNQRSPYFCAVDLTLFPGVLFGGWLMGRAVLALGASVEQDAFSKHKYYSARFYVLYELFPRIESLALIEKDLELSELAEKMSSNIEN